MNYKTTYRKILNRLNENRVIPGMENSEQLINQARANKLAEYLEDRQNRLNEQCEGCYKFARKNISIDVFHTPWDDEPHTLKYCSEKCMDEDLFERHDFCYFYCHECGRVVCEQNPSQGYFTQVREINGEQYCLRCYEKIILKDGIDLETFEEGRISGMFFSSGNPELIDAGYSEVKNVPGFIRSQESINTYCEKAIELINDGYKVVTAYERMGMGLEGYVTMFYRR